MEYIIPLAEMLAEIEGVKSALLTKVLVEYDRTIATFGAELTLLRNIPIEKIEKAGFARLALAIRRLREGNIVVKPGYDGVYGTIKVMQAGNEEREKQMSLL